MGTREWKKGVIKCQIERNSVLKQTDRQIETKVHLLSSAFAAKNNSYLDWQDLEEIVLGKCFVNCSEPHV